MTSDAVIYTPAVIDASALQLLLAILTAWLERQERNTLRDLVEENPRPGAATTGPTSQAD